MTDLRIETTWSEKGHFHERVQLFLDTPAGEHRIDGRVMTMLPLRNRRDGRVTRISEGLTEWRSGEHVGYGWSEYLDQVND